MARVLSGPPAGTDPAPMVPHRARTRAPAPRALLAGFAAIVVTQSAVTAWRLAASADGQPGARNLEALYHAVLTATALRQQPLRQTLGLPIVTLGGDLNAGYPWGATVEDRFGQFIYTSFPPGGFWLAALAIALPLGAAAALLVLNGLLGAGTGVLIAAVVRRAVVRSPHRAAAVPAAVLAGLAYVLSSESLQSHGPVYWPHAALQPVLAAELLLLLVILDEGCSRRRLLALAALTAAGGYIEWSEYVFAFGCAALILAVPALRRRMAGAALTLSLTAAATATMLFLHFTRRVPVDAATAAWTTRAGSRSDAPLLDLADGLRLSLGGTALALLIVLVAALVVGVRGRAPRRWLVIAAFAATPCLENLMLRQHAVAFSFDRLKDVVPLVLVLGFALALLARRGVLVGAAALLLGTVLSFALQLRDEAQYSSWQSIDAVNRKMITEASERIPFSCARFASSGIVRGYLNDVIGRSVVEWSSPDLVVASAAEQGNCGSVFIRTTPVFTDLPSIDEVTIRTVDGQEHSLLRPAPPPARPPAPLG